ncbi:MAG TPA: deoxyuridine 5'-triphosphate nucleotidohydrolase [Natrialbaceae archaeon]|nr:deoxyuridine 5'-triphosphate nucleotidohydrolase [Natrialbaceae archaeon]
MFRSGAFVAQHLSDVADEQVQPNGVDLTVDDVFEQREPGHVGRDGKEIGDRQAVETEQFDDAGPETFYLEPGGYVLRYDEVISIPTGHVGFVFPRSSLMRNSCMLNTAVWDTGYEGRGEGLLQVHHDVAIERGARVAQIVFAAADNVGAYDGSYQKENL